MTVGGSFRSKWDHYRLVKFCFAYTLNYFADTKSPENKTELGGISFEDKDMIEIYYEEFKIRVLR